MHFHLTEEQIAIQDSVRGALADCMGREQLHALVDGEADFDRASWEVLCQLGLMGIAVPEEFGGSGLGLVDAALVAEVLGEAAAPGPYIGQLLTAMALVKTDNTAAREQYLNDISSGQQVACLAFGDAWLPDAWSVTEENGSISGSVRFVQSASAANVFLVGLAGGGLALVANGDGVTVTPVKSSDRSRRLSTVEFENAQATVLMQPGDSGVDSIFDAGLVLVAADALGGARYCTDLSVAYAKEREQFGQQIGRFQALKHQLATMALEVEPSRGLLWYAAYAQDAQLADASHAASMAKAHICDRFVSVARAAIAAHGGIGYTWEYGLNIWHRRSLFNGAYLGSSSVHRARATDLSEIYQTV
jgi:alkylation response protein AidB-like acyl-CoA dehydrogenase